MFSRHRYLTCFGNPNSRKPRFTKTNTRRPSADRGKLHIGRNGAKPQHITVSAVFMYVCMQTYRPYVHAQSSRPQAAIAKGDAQRRREQLFPVSHPNLRRFTEWRARISRKPVHTASARLANRPRTTYHPLFCAQENGKPSRHLSPREAIRKAIFTCRNQYRTGEISTDVITKLTLVF